MSYAYVVYFRTTQCHPAVYTCYVHFIGRDQFRSHAMELIYFVNLKLIFVVNILFFFARVCLNSLVIVSFWRSVQLRKKLCYFMIMVLSCCDLLVVLTDYPVTALRAMLWLLGRMKKYPRWLVICYQLAGIVIGVSLRAVLVMTFNQYLATHYPLYHRASVTKRKLLTLFIFLVIFQITMTALSTNDLIVSYEVCLLVFFTLFIPPMLLMNYKLFKVAKKSRRNTEMLPGTKKSFSLKNVSSCLLVVACQMAFYIPNFIYIGLRLTSKETEYVLDNAQLLGLWSRTASVMNSTFNCLIFYWKNKTLRAEGMKVIKSMKICRRV